MLDRERATFERRRQEFLEQYQGKCVLIVDDKFLGAFDSEEQAYEAGIARFGRRDMLIKLIGAEEEPMPIAPALLVGLSDVPLQRPTAQ